MCELETARIPSTKFQIPARPSITTANVTHPMPFGSSATYADSRSKSCVGLIAPLSFRRLWPRRLGKRNRRPHSSPGWGERMSRAFIPTGRCLVGRRSQVSGGSHGRLRWKELKHDWEATASYARRASRRRCIPRREEDAGVAVRGRVEGRSPRAARSATGVVGAVRSAAAARTRRAGWRRDATVGDRPAQAARGPEGTGDPERGRVHAAEAEAAGDVMSTPTMPFGPVQMLVLEFDRTEFHGEVMPEIDRLKEAGIIRLLDLLFVRKPEGGDVEVIQRSDLSQDEAMEFGAMVGALVGLGTGDEENMTTAAVRGAEELEDGHLLGDSEVWYLSDSIPEGKSAAIALIEHLWAIPLRDKIVNAGGAALADGWIHPADLIAIGAVASDAASTS